MKEVNSIYNLTTDYNTANEFTNENEMTWDDVRNKVFCVHKTNKETVEDFISEKDYNPVKVIKDETEEYYLIDKDTKSSNSFRHQILSLMLVTREIYEKELSKLNDKPKTKVKR